MKTTKKAKQTSILKKAVKTATDKEQMNCPICGQSAREVRRDRFFFHRHYADGLELEAHLVKNIPCIKCYDKNCEGSEAAVMLPETEQRIRKTLGQAPKSYITIPVFVL